MKEDRERTIRLFANVGCYPQNFIGSKTFRCPVCSDNRKPGNRRKKCLSVKSMSDGVQFYCFNCDFHGGFFNDDKRKDTRPHRNEGNRGARARPRSRREAANPYRP